MYRYYLRAAQAILLRRAFEGQRLAAPTRLLFGAGDFYIPLAVLQDVEATAMTSLSTSSGAAVTGSRRSAPTSSPTKPKPCSGRLPATHLECA